MTTVAIGLWIDLMLRRGWAIDYFGEWLLENWVETAWIESVK